MDMLTQEKLQDLIVEYDIPYNHNIVIGHKKSEIKWEEILQIQNKEEFQSAEEFFVYFAPEGLCIFPVIKDWKAGDPLCLPWSAMRRFEVKKGLFIENQLRFTLPHVKVELKLTKKMMNNPWIRENTIFLESVNYYSKGQFT